MYVISLMPVQNSLNVSINHLDKLVHVTIYFIFTLVWFAYSYGILFVKPIHKSIVMVSLYAFFTGVIIEILQGTITKERSADGYDIFANSLGIVVAILLLYRIKKNNKLNSLK